MSSIRRWKTIHSQLVFDRPWCQVRQDQVELADGQVIDDYFVNVKPDIALVLAVTGDRDILFVRQYRHAVGEILLELPGGAFNPQQEDSLSAAARELEEETGFVAGEMRRLKTLYDSPGKDTNKIHLLLAKDVRPTGTRQLDITEDIEVVPIPVDEISEKIATGEICVCGTITALFLGLPLLSQPA